MEYRAHLSHTILSESGARFASGRREIVLPFAPYPGLSIGFEPGWSHEVLYVEWDIERQVFVCSSEEKERLALDTFLDMEFLIDIAKECGFKGFTIRDTV